MTTTKTANDVQIGDIVLVQGWDGERRTVKVTYVSEDIKNGRAGFDGIRTTDGLEVWAYCDQIAQFISHATKEDN